MCYMGVRIPAQGKGKFGDEQTWACLVGLQSGMDLWGDDAAFCQITLTSCFNQYQPYDAHNTLQHGTCLRLLW